MAKRVRGRGFKLRECRKQGHDIRQTGQIRAMQYILFDKCFTCSSASVRRAKGFVAALPEKSLACTICCREDFKRLVPDHNHQTGQFRGWLCDSCNLMIGWLETRKISIAIVEKYLSMGSAAEKNSENDA